MTLWCCASVCSFPIRSLSHPCSPLPVLFWRRTRERLQSSTTPPLVIGFLSVLQYKAQPLCLLANQPWAAQRATCRPLPSRIAIAPPLPVLNGYLSNDNHCCYCPGVGLLKEFNRAPTSPPLLVWLGAPVAKLKDGRRSTKWNTAHCHCPVNVVGCRRVYQRSASRQSMNS